MSKDSKQSIGSKWRIWDLHVHTPFSHSVRGTIEDFITNAQNSVAEVIGINDYATLEGYKSIIDAGGIPNKILFPVIELRMNNVLTNKHNSSAIHLNFHIIFDNDDNKFADISHFVDSLECPDSSRKTRLLGTISKEERMSVTFDFENVVNRLKDLNLYETHALIWLPYDEYGGIDDINPDRDAIFKARLINLAHIMGSSTAKQIDFFKWKHDRFTQDQFRTWFDRKKPCIKGSDAHKISYPFGQLMDANSNPIEKYCWVNAEPTFNGLRQIVYEPDRVYIGHEPELLKRKKLHPTKFIESIAIKKVPDVEIDSVWFDEISLKLNSSLVAIIGNKGNGKSALTDILALCGNTRQKPKHFSFLVDAKFKNKRPVNLSEAFEATIVWGDGTPNTCKLSDLPDSLLPERVRYIPQNFFEILCADIESSAFEDELKEIVFSHIPDEQRLGHDSFERLVEHKSEQIELIIERIQSQLSQLNSEIVTLETQSLSTYRTEIEGRIKHKENELVANDAAKPIAPEEEDAETSVTETDLSQIRDDADTLKKEIEELTLERKNIFQSIDNLERAERHFKEVDAYLHVVLNPSDQHIETLTNFGIAPDEVLRFSVDTSPIRTAIDNIRAKLIKVELLLDPKDESSKVSKLEKLNETIAKKMELLDKPARLRQKYLSDLEEWEKFRNVIVGDENTPGSLAQLRLHLKYLKEILPRILSSKLIERDQKFIELFTLQVELKDIRSELFEPISVLEREFPDLHQLYNVRLNVGLSIKNFAEEFLAFINQNRSGSFLGRDEGFARISEMIDGAQIDTSGGLIEFINSVRDSLKYDYRADTRTEVKLETQLRQGKTVNELYDFLYHANYLIAHHSLVLGDKELKALSPGERGTLLLIFYLLLDKDNIPLLIDQPEDNLDNESIFRILVEFIKRVKGKRQVIIVTHNPNLAIVCDADQIIRAQIDKADGNRVLFTSGAIEDSDINQASIDILEGTLPAFDNRHSKYQRY